MNDDELGRFLRDEIPEPGEGYWDQIDARIAAASVERGAVDSTVTNATQTDENVIRLTAMNDTIESPRSRFGPTLAALAAALVLLAGVGFVLTRDGDSTEVATGGEEDTADGSDASGAGSTDDGGATQDTSDDSANVVERDLGDAELPSIAPGEYVVVGSETVEAKLNPITDEAGLDAFFEPGADVLSATGRRALYEDVEFLEMIVDADAKPLWFPAGSVLLIGETLPTLDRFQVQVPDLGRILLRATPGLADADETSAEPGDRLDATGRRALVDHREWIEVSVAGQRRWVFATDVVDVGTARGAETLSPVAAADWEVGRGGELEILDTPAFSGNLIGGAEIGGIVSGTGERVLADGVEWYEILIAEGQFGWVMANTVQAPDTIFGGSRLCYAAGPDVLVLAFSDDAETFTGALAIGDSIEAVAGVRAGSDFIVATEPIGAAEEPGFEVGQEIWRAFAEGMNIGDLAFLDFVECRVVQTMVDQLDALVGTYPDIPFPD